METKNNGAAVKNATIKANGNHSQNGNATTSVAPNQSNGNDNKPALIDKAVELTLNNQTPAAEKQPVELTLEARLKVVNELHRRSVQRINLIGRMRQLEAFEIALVQGNDELEENPYQGCKLIIRDDQNRDFVTTTPGLIRMVAKYIFVACDQKLQELESLITFPGI